MSDTMLPPLPEPWDYCYEWDGPYGARKLIGAQHCADALRALKGQPT